MTEALAVTLAETISETISETRAAAEILITVGGLFILGLLAELFVPMGARRVLIPVRKSANTLVADNE